MANEGFHTLPTCYTSTLAIYLAGVIRERERLFVCTFHQLSSRMVREANIELPSPDGPEQRKVFDEDYPDTLIRAVELRPDPKYDAIIFDEGQDFQDTWWLALEVCLSKGRQSILYVFYGDNQHVYRNPGSIPADLQHFPLTENVRESLNTARVEIGR